LGTETGGRKKMRSKKGQETGTLSRRDHRKKEKNRDWKRGKLPKQATAKKKTGRRKKKDGSIHQQGSKGVGSLERKRGWGKIPAGRRKEDRKIQAETRAKGEFFLTSNGKTEGVRKTVGQSLEKKGKSPVQAGGSKENS